MILIKDVTVIDDVSGYSVDVPYNMTKRSFRDKVFGADKIEHVQGTNIINERGEEVCLGATKAVEETIGLAFKTLRDQALRIAEDHATIIKLKSRLEENHEILCRIAMLGLWGRIKFLFKPSTIDLTEIVPTQDAKADIHQLTIRNGKLYGKDI